jgi:hypothetical protein
LSAQIDSESELSYSKETIHLPEKITSSPQALVEALTEAKNSDIEKFTAIFTWVAANIKYNFHTYYSTNATGKTNVKKMLKHKSGICIDYASLMDTLCTLAGIINVSVYGYAKDEIFDVSDSIYVDNHAWNAVKLDGKWYVYDVTWASGDADYRYTKFSNFLLKTERKFPIRYKRKRVRKSKSYFFVDDCGNEFKSPTFYYKERIFNRVVRKLLHLFKLRIEKHYTQKVNPNFYLTEPDLFAITHFPDNPIWSLTAKKSMRDFETDSAFYHLNDSSYVNQNRVGQICSECDYDVSLDELNKYHYLRRQSFNFNKRNQFITSLCEYKIGSINFNNSADVLDSLPKITLLDTSIHYLQKAKASLRASYRNVDIDFLLQKNKNKHKQMLLLTENRNHLNFVREKINITLAQKRNIKSLENKSLVNKRKYKRRKENINRLKSSIFVDVKSNLSVSKLKELHAYHAIKELEIDSLNELISRFKIRFDSILINLSLNVWQKVMHHDSLISPILKSTELRKLLKDNLKKPVVELRKHMPIYEINYSRDIYDIVYTPARILSDFSTELFNLIEKRNNYENDHFHTKLLLVKFNELALAELPNYKSSLQEENKYDYCWLKGKIPSIKSTYQGFKSLKDKQTATLQVMVNENETERFRTHFISMDLLRRKKKYRRIVVNNIQVSNTKLIEVKKEKRKYLNFLKKERREAAKK